MTFLAVLFCVGFGLYLLSYVPLKVVRGAVTRWGLRFKDYLDNG